MSDEEMISVPREALRALFDVAVGSLDFGSGFWDQEDVDAAREIAVRLDVCPTLATPTDMRAKYPRCSGMESALARYRDSWALSDSQIIGFVGHEDHAWKESADGQQ
ncbi:MAG TPA: hypothetical protein VFG35_14515 [Actinoplanes sp.]|nr:hypothetical protein [Actinoplanes sp.]